MAFLMPAAPYNQYWPNFEIWGNFFPIFCFLGSCYEVFDGQPSCFFLHFILIAVVCLAWLLLLVDLGSFHVAGLFSFLFFVMSFSSTFSVC